MKCFYCNSVIDSDSKFCPKCGKELINICPKCGQKNDPSSNFCKNCGTKIHDEPIEKKPTPKKEEPDEEALQKRKDKATIILSIISMSLMIASMVLVFGLSFSAMLKDNFFPASEYTIINQIVQIFKTGFKDLASSYQFITIAYPFILLTLLVAITVLFIIFIATGIPKFVKSIKNKSYHDFSISVTILFMVYLLLASFFVGFVLKQEGSENASLSDSVIQVLVYVPLALSFNLFVKEFAQNKHSLFNIIFRGVARLLIYVFAIVAIFNVGGYRFHIIYFLSSSYSTSNVTDCGNLGVISFILRNLDSIESTTIPALVGIFSLSLVAFALEISFVICACLLLRDILTNDIAEKQKYVSKIILSAVMLAFSIAVLILNIVSKSIINEFNSVDKYGIKMEATLLNTLPIVCIVMSALLLAVSIVFMSVDKPRNQVKEVENEAQ